MPPDAPPRAGWQPAEEDQLLLQALVLPGPAGHNAWCAWSARVPFDDIVGPGFRLLPALYQVLQASHAAASDVPRLRGIHRKNWYENQLRLAALETVIGALSSAGVKTLLLAGALPPSPAADEGHARNNDDMACAVLLDQVPAALQTFERLGWRPAQASANPQRHWPYLAGMVFQPAHGQELIRLVWRLAPGTPTAPGQSGLWQRSQPLSLAGHDTRGLDVTDQLWLACATGAVWRAQPDWRWLVDAVQLVRSGQIDWARLVETSRQSQTTCRSREALGYLSTVLQAPVPSDTLAQLQSTAIAPSEARLFELTSRPPRGLDAAHKHWLQYQSRTAGTRSPAGFVHYLEAEWALRSSRQVLLAAAQRALTRFN